MIYPSSLSYSPRAGVCPAHHPCGMGFSFDSEFIPLDLMAKFSFHVGTFALCRLKLTPDPIWSTWCNPSDLQESVLVLATRH